MRLFEIDLGGARDILALLTGLADKNSKTSEVPFPVVKNLFKSFGYPIGDGGIRSKEALIKIKGEVDPLGKVIKDVTDNASIILNTETPAPTQAIDVNKSSPTVDAMASRAAKKLNPDI